MSSASASDTFADLRDYQVRAFDNIWDAFTVNKAQSTLVVHATGVGKTVLLAEVAKHAIHTLDWNVLFVAHRERLLTQTVAKFDRVGVDTCLEIADQKALRLVKSPKLAMMGDKAAKCVIGSVQTLKGKRLAAWPKDYFQLVIVDEAHHSPADSYLALINHFKSAKLLGVTATPDRLDGQNLGSIYRSVADKYFLPQAIREQWLAPVEWFKFKEKIDLRGLKCGKDFSDGELETRIMPLAERLCSDITMKIGSRPTMVFVPAKRSANLFADAFRQLGATAVAIHEDTPDRNAVEREFEHGEHQILVSCMVYTEGADFPFVESVVPLRATRSGALLSQMVGRGTRPSPATGKENCLVLDFTWLCDKHKPVSAVTLMYPEASDMEIDLIERALGEEKQIDLLAAADRVKKICQARASKEEMDAIRQSQEKARLRVSMNPSNVGFKKVNWSGVTVEDVLGNKGKAIEFSKHVKKPTQRQFQALLAFGIEAKDMEGITARRASKYIDYLREEKAAGKSSYRQRKTLMKEGYSREEAAAFSAAEASKLIGDIIGKRSNYLRSPRDEYPTSRPEA